METEINLPFITATDKGPKHLNLKLSRSQLEKLIDPLVQRCKKPVEQALKDAKVTKDNIDKVILVGGPTRMPAVKKLIESLLGKKAEGGIDPMECVAMGAAIQGGVLSGDVKDVLLLDVTPLTLGIETLGGVRTPLITRNTTIPSKKTQIFSTAADNQPSVDINVLQGEREMATDNKALGKFLLDGIPPAPRGIPQIEVTFDIDANGILSVSAKDLGTGKRQSIKITATQKLSDKEVEKMRKEAEEYAEQDKKRKELVELRNQADSVVYSTEKMLSEYGDKVDKDTKEKVQKEMNEIKEVMKEEDAAKIKNKLEEANKVIQEIGMKMYQEAAKKQTDNKKDDNTVDAEVVEEDKEDVQRSDDKRSSV